MAKLRTPLICALVVLALGFASGFFGGSAVGDPWFEALKKPAFQPPGWAFPVAWTALYLMTGWAFGLVLDAPHSRARSAGVGAFVTQLVLNLAWSPLFFRVHQITWALALILVILVAAVVATIRFRQIRPVAAALMLPYLAWLVFASSLNGAIVWMNPGIR